MHCSHVNMTDVYTLARNPVSARVQIDRSGRVLERSLPTGLRSEFRSVDTRVMVDAVPWYAKPWRNSSLGRRARWATFGYLFGGAGYLILAITTDRNGARVSWAVAGLVFTYLGLTLLATLLRQRPSRST